MAYTEFYCQTTGSNLNAGSTTADAAVYTATNGGWNSGTGVFTPTSGDPSATVSVGDFASVFLDAATVAVFIGRVTAVNSTTITVSTTAKSGTAPTTAGTGITCKVGGAWKGPNGTEGFPFNFVAAAMTNSAGDSPRVNIKSGTTYSITAAMTHTVAGLVTFEGYTTSAGDNGRATIDGGTSGASYVLLAISSNNIVLRNLIFQNNGATGSANGVTHSSGTGNIEGCVFNSVRGTGCVASFLSECEAYACNQSNTANLAGFSVSIAAFRCISHDNSGSNSNGFVTTSNVLLFSCIADTNGSNGLFFNDVQNGSHAAIGCDSYNNGGDGIRISNNSNIATYLIENCSLVKNGGYGVFATGSPSRTGIVRNCGFGAGTQANTSGTTTGLKSMVESGGVNYASDVTPWTDPANGDFRISLAAAQGTGRGTFTQTAASYTGTVGYPDIGAAQHQETAGSGGASVPSINFGQSGVRIV